ncbi:MAG: hypothetical protein C4295_07865 [Candidatus Fervidibacterota bacterium]
MSQHRDGNQRLSEIVMERRRRLAQRQQQRWQELEQLIRQAQSWTIRYLSANDLLRLGKLYRLATAELARANSSLMPAHPLHRLVGWGYSVLYAQSPLQRLRIWSAFAHWIWRDFPASVVAHLSFILLAAVALSIGATLTALVVLWRSEVAMAWLGEEMFVILQEVAQRHQPGRDWLPLMGRPFAFWVILLNNWRVALMGFGFGVSVILPSLYVLFVNGKLVGGVLAVSYQVGTLTELFGFIVPHGIVELPAFCFASAAGIAMGYHWLCPGDLPRLAAMVQAGRKAVPLLVGSLAMLLYAAFVEAFFSPHAKIPALVKWLFSGLEFAALIGYLTVRGLSSVVGKK